MSIRIGGSVGGRYSRPIKGTTCYENRILQNNEHSYFWQDSKFCLDNGIYLIVNIDTYMTGSRWTPQGIELRDFTIATKNTLRSIGANKFNCRFTWDNESLEYTNLNDYYGKLRVIHDALTGMFDLGAGNFRTSQLPAYAWLASKYDEGYFEVFDIHYQDGMDDVSDIEYIGGQFNAMVEAYNIKRVAVTEGNNFWNVRTPQHNLLKHQIDVAEGYGCEDFCFAFVNWTLNGEEDHSNMSYCENDTPISDNWGDMLNVIKQKKPEVIVVYGIEINYVKPGSKNEETRAVQQIMIDEGYDLGSYGADGIYGPVTLEAITKWQTDNGLQVDGWVGKETWQWIFEEIDTGMKRFLQMIARTGRYK
jgi:hypothetical protein